MEKDISDNGESGLYEELYSVAIILLKHGSKTGSIETHLKQKTEDIVLITVVIKEAKKEHYAQTRKQGYGYIVTGVVFILAGFLITVLNFHTNRSFDYAMYGFTSIGIGLVFVGLYKIIG